MGELHDMLALDLIQHLNTVTNPHFFAVSEVTVDTSTFDRVPNRKSRRFDVVAVDPCWRRACVFEVKVSRRDAQNWIESQGWKRAQEHGAAVAIATPESLGRFDLPDGVRHLTKGLSWSFSSTISGWWCGPPSAELLMGMLRALRENRRYWEALPILGASLVDSLLEKESA